MIIYRFYYEIGFITAHMRDNNVFTSLYQVENLNEFILWYNYLSSTLQIMNINKANLA